MKAYRDKLQAQSGAYQQDTSPANQRQKAAAKYHNLASNAEVSVEELQDALMEVMSMLEGSEAQAALLTSELAAAQDTIRSQTRRVTRGGRVGKSCVYTQAAINADFEQKQVAEGAQNLAKQQSTSRGHGCGCGQSRGRGRGCGRGCSRGRDQGQAPNESPNQTDLEYKI